ncbi:hypothetical protein HGRIS_009577 [Hohenbuehelia grisea]|uniref:PUB domain-containing protein n=1 Tax=Hohenbuehelia grisea TaxID=104357 RepID=A0ABR3J1Z9_9AGAR
MTSPTTSDSPRILAEALAAAAERRTQEASAGPSQLQLIEEHEKRQAFRRLIDPGIVRPNSKEVAMSSLKTLSTIAENLLREPDNPKYQQFKPTNAVIKQKLVDPKGALEYAIALGFRAEVKNFQPYYVFNPRRKDDLLIGAAILKDAIELETSKHDRAVKSKQEEKAAIEAAALKVKLAFMDDRKTKRVNDEREKQLREARAARAAAGDVEDDPDMITHLRGDSLQPDSPSSDTVHILGGAPPSYHAAASDSDSD